MLMKYHRILNKGSELNPVGFFQGNYWKRWVPGVVVVGLLFGTSLVVAAPSAFRIEIDGLSPYYSPKSAQVRVNQLAL